MTEYERTFGKPVPDGFREVRVCLGCGEEDPCKSDCPAGVGFVLKTEQSHPTVHEHC